MGWGVQQCRACCHFGLVARHRSVRGPTFGDNCLRELDGRHGAGPIRRAAGVTRTRTEVRRSARGGGEDGWGTGVSKIGTAMRRQRDGNATAMRRERDDNATTTRRQRDGKAMGSAEDYAQRGVLKKRRRGSTAHAVTQRASKKAGGVVPGNGRARGNGPCGSVLRGRISGRWCCPRCRCRCPTNRCCRSCRWNRWCQWCPRCRWCRYRWCRWRRCRWCRQWCR